MLRKLSRELIRRTDTPLAGGLIPRILSPLFQTVHFSPYYQLSILVGAPCLREYTFPVFRYRIILGISHTRGIVLVCHTPPPHPMLGREREREREREKSVVLWQMQLAGGKRTANPDDAEHSGRTERALKASTCMFF